MTVLVTGAGGPAGIAVIRDLMRRGERVVAVDASEMAVGLELASEGCSVPRADEPGFIRALVGVASSTGCDAVVCTVAEEMAAIHGGESEFAACDVATWVPEPRAVRSCLDKWCFSLTAASSGVSLPATDRDGSSIPGPWIVKPRFGRGSRDVLAVDCAHELAWALRRVPDPIVQTRVSGREFTVDALVDRQGELIAAVPRWRLETRGGISVSGETFEDQRVTDGTGALLTALGLRGIANVQGFVTDDDRVEFIEVNPRFSGGLPLSLAAEAELVTEYLRLVRGLSARPERLQYRAGVRMRRYFEEVIDG